VTGWIRDYETVLAALIEEPERRIADVRLASGPRTANGSAAGVPA
jgi:hypothetical protein